MIDRQPEPACREDAGHAEPPAAGRPDCAAPFETCVRPAVAVASANDNPPPIRIDPAAPLDRLRGAPDGMEELDAWFGPGSLG
ncbi:hypothetical protein DFR50_110143 [Roseiarcus fermentans]|uniref:Uncharacterized protein n=1 Tax=Roseiarcus fermentans TaxID=1473586 RepID=A0A366FHN8_9HYPH|nr:hypothetical protein [Roseiarcus fermentans]RBP14117.1 hypothetical protein DFR50_110143 [Roseiarcus fermentans]